MYGGEYGWCGYGCGCSDSVLITVRYADGDEYGTDCDCEVMMGCCVLGVL